jgi:hypothetical protein
MSEPNDTTVKSENPRLVPEEPLPPYAFVPGRFPHPESDPAGHSFGRTRSAVPPLDPDQPSASRVYLRGLDLFNAQFYWESHVEFESLWIACGRKGIVAEFLKGLIKLAAAGVKHREQKPVGVKSHAGRAVNHWRQVARERDWFLGFPLAELIQLADRIDRDGWPEPPPVLLPVFRDTGSALKTPSDAAGESPAASAP